MRDDEPTEAGRAACPQAQEGNDGVMDSELQELLRISGNSRSGEGRLEDEGRIMEDGVSTNVVGLPAAGWWVVE